MNKKEDIYKITILVLLLDQFIKYMINKFMEINTSIKVIPNFFSIFYVRNKGAAFSILEDSTILIIIISVIFIVILDSYIKKEKNFTPLSVLSLGMIMGGIFGNLMDRVIYHSVIDYLSFGNFPVFNLADIGITVGVGLLIISEILKIRKDKENDRSIQEVLPKRKRNTKQKNK
ncbi:MAG: signal peptidase II [Bacilli bacterium]|nr:signal peptidase II [Bacilli bacterium]